MSLAECIRELDSVIPHKNRYSDEELALFATRVTRSMIRHRLVHPKNQVWVDAGRYDLGYDKHPKSEDRYVASWMQAAVKYHGESLPIGIDTFVRPNHKPIIGIEFLQEETVFYTDCHLGQSVGFLVPDNHRVSFGCRAIV